MCELMAMSSLSPATVNVALRELAKHGGGEGPERDGWGIAYHEEGDFRLIKDAQPAYASPWVDFVEGIQLRSNIVLAHIRKATAGTVRLRNCHPFARELYGRPHVFAHNGTVKSIFDNADFPIGRFRPLGETDSERAFCALLTRIEKAGLVRHALPERAERIELVATFAAEVCALGHFNFIYSDGDLLFLYGDTRNPRGPGSPDGPGLHFLIEHDHADGQPFDGAGGITVADAEHPVLLAASVPLTQGNWQPLKRGELLVVAEGKVLERVRT